MPYSDTIKEKRLQKRQDDEQRAFVESIKAVSSDIRTLLNALEVSGAKKLDSKVVDAIGSLKGITDALSVVKIRTDDDVKSALKTIAVILKGLDVKPIVNVPAPQVTVNEREINLAPLEKAIAKQKGIKVDPLSTYKAQDINNDDPHVQYVGFVNEKGNWYIIENNETTNSLRYVFGEKNYLQAMKKPSELTYRLYSEAINAAKA